MTGWFQQCFGAGWQTDVMIMALLVTMPGVVVFMWRVQRTVNGIDFNDWWRGADGKASWKQAAGIGGFMVGSWCMIYVTLTGKVPDGYVLLFLAYMAICIGSPTALQIIGYLRGNTQLTPEPPPAQDAPKLP